MLVLHFEGPAQVAPREWLDTGNPAFAESARPWVPPRRGRDRFVQPLLIGSHGETKVVLPGLAPLHAMLLQPRPGELEVRATSPSAVVKIDGEVVTDFAPLPLGAALQLGPWTVRIFRTQPLSPERQQRLAALAKDPQGWRVFADELEEAGDATLAQWLRLERAVTDASRSQLRVLGSELPLSQRATVASVGILNCERPATQCPGTWDQLTLDAEACLRTCKVCEKKAVYCEDEQEAAEFAMRGQWVVVLDAGRPQPRKPWPMMTIG